MKTSDLTTITRIIANLIICNMDNGSSFETAKEQAYNRMEKEYPEVFEAYLLAI